MSDGFDARAAIAEGLGPTGGTARDDPNRSSRRRARAAADFRRDETLEQMSELQRTDPQRFEALYGARGALMVGLYRSGAQAAGIDLEEDQRASED